MDRRMAKPQQLIKKLSVKQMFMLLSVSLFSLVFSASNLPSFLQPVNFYIFPFRLLTHAVDKNCIFLLCNGILVFLARSSGLIRSSRFRSNGSQKHLKTLAFDYNDERLRASRGGSDNYTVMENFDGLYNSHEEMDKLENVEGLINKDCEVAEGGGELKIPIEEEETCETLPSLEEVDGFDRIGDDRRDDDQMEEEERGEEDEEELNKKFDEFIRRMKEEITIEDQTQLVVV